MSHLFFILGFFVLFLSSSCKNESKKEIEITDKEKTKKIDAAFLYPFKGKLNDNFSESVARIIGNVEVENGLNFSDKEGKNGTVIINKSFTEDDFTISFDVVNKKYGPTMSLLMVNEEGKSWKTSPLWVFLSKNKISTIFKGVDLRKDIGDNTRFEDLVSLKTDSTYRITYTYSYPLLDIYLDESVYATYDIQDTLNTFNSRQKIFLGGIIGDENKIGRGFNGTIKNFFKVDEMLTREEISYIIKEGIKVLD